MWYRTSAAQPPLHKLDFSDCDREALFISNYICSHHPTLSYRGAIPTFILYILCYAVLIFQIVKFLAKTSCMLGMCPTIAELQSYVYRQLPLLQFCIFATNKQFSTPSYLLFSNMDCISLFLLSCVKSPEEKKNTNSSHFVGGLDLD